MKRRAAAGSNTGTTRKSNGTLQIFVRGPQGEMETLSPGEFLTRFSVEYTTKLIIDPTLPPESPPENEDKAPLPQPWQRPSLQLYFGEAIAPTLYSQAVQHLNLRNWLYGDLVRRSYEADLYLALVNDSIGYGVFAREDIVPGDLIGEYTGVARARTDDESANLYNFNFGWKTTVDAGRHGNYTRYINHSKLHVNCHPIRIYLEDGWHILLVATRPIAIGKQLLFDYGDGYWSKRPDPVEFE